MKKRFGFTLPELIVSFAVVLGIILTSAAIFYPADAGTGFVSQWMAKKLGGIYEVHLAPNSKLMNLTWKKEQLWVLTRQAHKDEVANETYTFKEDSLWGVLEGTVLIKESEGR